MTDQTMKRAFRNLEVTRQPHKGPRYLKALLRRARAARAYRHLARLPDHLLEDIGVTRNQVETLAANGFRQRPPWTERQN